MEPSIAAPRSSSSIAPASDAVTGQRLPGWLGDTLCFTPGQVARLCEGAGFTVVEVTEGLRHWGLPVFLYLRLSRRE